MKNPYAPSEHGEQCALMEWWSLQHGKKPWGPLLFAIPNGGLRSKATAGKLRAEGVRAGVPDLFLAWPNGKYPGLFLEMKTRRGRLSAEQKEMLLKLAQAGYAATVAYGYDEACRLLDEYLAGGQMPGI